MSRLDLKPLTYEELADACRVSVKTIRNWKSRGVFKIQGYKRLGKWKKIALVSVEEAKKTIQKSITRPR